jgi:hypothetical protein
MSHPHEDELVLHYYGELLGPEAGNLERHLRECTQCRDSFARLERVLRTIEATPVPEPVDGFEADVWAHLRPGLRAVGPASRPVRNLTVWFGAAPRWVLAGGVATLLAIAFLAGALWRETNRRPEATVAGGPGTTAPGTTAPGTTAPGTQHPLAPGTGHETPGTSALRQRLLLAAVGEHLERTELVLVELMNAHGRGPVDISAEQLRAADLASENRLYRQTAESVGDQAVVSLLDQLDLILTELAGGPSALAQADLDSMRQRIERQDLLFKVQAVASDLRERQRADLARRMRATS